MVKIYWPAVPQVPGEEYGAYRTPLLPYGFLKYKGSGQIARSTVFSGWLVKDDEIFLKCSA